MDKREHQGKIPKSIPVDLKGIPSELQALDCWGCWKNVLSKGSNKPKKIPFRSRDGRAAKTTSRTDWGSFHLASDRYQQGGYDGLAFAFFPEHGLVGIDRDDCRDPETNTIQPWALEEMATLATYAEVSPSGRGYKQIGYGRLPDGARSSKPGSQSEFYDGLPGRERYFAITGQRVPSAPSGLLDVSKQVVDAHKRMMQFDVRVAFGRRNWLRDERDKKQLVQCPWASQHTKGDDEAALLKQRGRRGGYAFRCLHSHCENRTIADVYVFFNIVDTDGLEDARPPLILRGDLHRTTQDIWDLLADINEASPTRPAIYLFGNSFGRITRMTVDEKPAIELLTTDKFRELLAALIRFQKEATHHLTAAYPPDIVVRNLLATAEPPVLPRIRRVVSAPVFASDGSLLTTPGFHAKARVFYAPDFEPRSVALAPSPDEIAEACRLLEEELFVDFPFVGQCDRAHAVALLLLFFARDMIDGDLPLHLIEKPEVGTGAGKLADACLIPALGRRPPTLTDCDDEDEWRKRITALVRHAPEAVLLDNITKIDSHQLAALFTTGKWQDRILGSTQVVELPADMPWVATGNNPGNRV